MPRYRRYPYRRGGNDLFFGPFLGGFAGSLLGDLFYGGNRYPYYQYPYPYPYYYPYGYPYRPYYW
ncbi:hypothetical protein SAMN04488127_2988 [Bhargavaea ginsengi]|uniref:Uncharacterized protein n=1 Tax=Bhargavaea ginsengi TaxID=426757 RepID=A0A1H7C1D6_9BACL|nr:hypothetical protein [Bhargavaea ginsengi]MCM3087694.1 hypothetical protein [Bhargavaea ginsengi]SEJ83673.1 hypothetical protein SAMN04488127_2988 [Bhargavaea ginsengi]